MKRRLKEQEGDDNMGLSDDNDNNMSDSQDEEEEEEEGDTSIFTDENMTADEHETGIED